MPGLCAPLPGLAPGTEGLGAGPDPVPGSIGPLPGPGVGPLFGPGPIGPLPGPLGPCFGLPLGPVNIVGCLRPGKPLGDVDCLARILFNFLFASSFFFLFLITRTTIIIMITTAINEPTEIQTHVGVPSLTFNPKSVIVISKSFEVLFNTWSLPTY